MQEKLNFRFKFDVQTESGSEILLKTECDHRLKRIMIRIRLYFKKQIRILPKHPDQDPISNPESTSMTVLVYAVIV